MSWLNEATVETAFAKNARKQKENTDRARAEGIEAAKESEGLKTYTIEQATQFIENQIDSASNLEQLKTRLKNVLTKMVPYIL